MNVAKVFLLFTPLELQSQTNNFLPDNSNSLHLDTFSVFCGIIIIILFIIILLTVLIIRSNIQTKKSKRALEKKEQKLNEIQEETNKYIKRINRSFVDLTVLMKANDPLFSIRFQETYPEFTHNLFKKHPDLIKGEFLLCAMIFLNFSSKQIAEYTQVKHRSIQTRKSRLRKKMNLFPEVDLHYYMKTFDK